VGVINGVAREPPRGIFLLGMGPFGGIVRWAGARVSYLESLLVKLYLWSRAKKPSLMGGGGACQYGRGWHLGHSISDPIFVISIIIFIYLNQV